MRRTRPHLSYANVMSTIAVFGVLAGGTAWAASKIGTNQIERGAVTAKKLHKNAVTTKKIKDEAVTGEKAKESSFGQVPEAGHADDAAKLDGQPASDYRLHCPGDLDRAGDLCYEVDARPSASYAGARKPVRSISGDCPMPASWRWSSTISAHSSRTSGRWAISPTPFRWLPCSVRARPETCW